MKYKIITIVLLIVTITSKADTLNVPLHFSSIQLALDTSEINDVIMVQPGIYFENLVWPSINSIHLISAGDTSNTFIDGGNYGRVITMNNYLGVIDTSTIIKGFTIQNGSMPDSLNYRGAGLYIYNCSPKLLNLRIRNNKSRGYSSWGVGMYIRKSNSIIEDVTISYCEVPNSEYIFGFGIFCDSSHLVINKLRISDLISDSESECSGAGIYSRSSFINLSDYTFEDNHLTVKYCEGGAINTRFDTIILHDFEFNNNSFTSFYESGRIKGGGIFIKNAIGEITNGSITNNYSNAYGIGSYCNGGGIYIGDLSDIKITDVFVTDNTADSDNRTYGTGIFVSDSSTVDIDHCSFSNNTLSSDSRTHGGGIYIRDKSVVTILNSDISENISTHGARWYYGGGIYTDDSQLKLINSIVSKNVFGPNGTWYYGGGIYANDESDIIVTNSTITGNIKVDTSSIRGSGIYLNSSSLIMTNSICRNKNNALNNEIEVSGTPIGTKTIAYSNTRGLSTGPGNIDSDPLFVSDNDFHLQALSPCKNTGNPDTSGLNIPLFDIEGNPRIYEEIIDMGAYENQEQSVSIDLLEENVVVVFPNPTNDIFYITGTDVLNVQVVNEFGQVIIEKRKKSKIDLGSYVNGIYMIKITTEKQTITRKLIKQ